MNNVAHYRLSNQPEKAYLELCAFFSQYLHINPAKEGGMCSRTSSGGVRRCVEKKDIVTRPTRKEVTGWKGIKSKHRRAALLSRFIEQVEKTHDLTKEQVDELTYALHKADIADNIDSSIRMEDGLISSIECLDYDGDHFYLVQVPKERRHIRIPPPSNPIYKRYPAKQVDPDALFAAHFTQLKKHNASSTVQRASAFIEDSRREEDKDLE